MGALAAVRIVGGQHGGMGPSYQPDGCGPRLGARSAMLRQQETPIVSAGFDASKPEPDFFLVESNPEHWAVKYIHPQYNGTKALEFVQVWEASVRG